MIKRQRSAHHYLKWTLLIVVAFLVSGMGLVVAKNVTKPLGVEVRTHIKIAEQDAKGKWRVIDTVGPVTVNFDASLLELAQGKELRTAFQFRTTSKNGLPYSVKLVDAAKVSFNPLTGKLEGQLMYEIQYGDLSARVRATISTESRSGPLGMQRGARAKGILGKDPTDLTVVGTNDFIVPGKRALKLICKEQYKLKPKG